MSREYSNVEREHEHETGLALSIPPVEPAAGKEEPDYRTINKEDADGQEEQHELGRRDEGVVGTAERAAEAAVHPEENGKTAVSDAPRESASNGVSTDNAPVTDGSKDASFVSLDSDDDQEEHATSTRTRLAEAARAENQRREQVEQVPESAPGSTAHSRTGSVQYSGVRMANGRPNWTSGAGLPAGLIYSDESDSEGSSDDELGVGLGTSRKTSGAGSVTKSPKMSRDERDRRVFGDDLGDRSLMERVKNVAGVAGAAGVGGIGLTGMRQVSQHRSKWGKILIVIVVSTRLAETARNARHAVAAPHSRAHHPRSRDAYGTSPGPWKYQHSYSAATGHTRRQGNPVKRSPRLTPRFRLGSTRQYSAYAVPHRVDHTCPRSSA